MTETYTELSERLARAYEPKAIAFLNRIRALCADHAIITLEPADNSADEWVWSTAAWLDGRKGEAVEIKVSMQEEREFEGGDGWGFTFVLSLIGWGGEVLGEVAPFNFTPYVWVDGRVEEALDDRWQEVESCNIDGLPNILLTHFNGDDDV